MPRPKKIKPIKRQIEFDMNLPVREERSPQRHLAKSILREALVAEAIKSMGVKPGETSVVHNLVEGRDYPEIMLSQDERGYITRPKLSEPANYKSGGMYAKKKKYDNGGKVTGARTRESFGPAAQDEYIRRVNAALERRGEEPLSEAEEAQRRARISDMERMKSLMGRDYRPVYTGGKPHKNYDALKEAGKFGGTGILTPMNLVEEILMSLPKKELQYGKGGTVKYRSGGMMKYPGGGMMPSKRGMMYENGGSERDMKRPGRSVVSFRNPSKEMLDRNDGFFLPIPMEPEQGGVLIPRELENMEKMAIKSGDPEAIAEYEAAMTEFMDSPEYKEQQEALNRRFQSAKSQYGEAKADYDTRKVDYDKMREAMRMIMNSRLQ
tara:strand:- start:364 stop:1503 length:1140 start_codon:yes stop_codon:yes gene_type:complete